MSMGSLSPTSAIPRAPSYLFLRGEVLGEEFSFGGDIRDQALSLPCSSGTRMLHVRSRLHDEGQCSHVISSDRGVKATEYVITTS